MPESNSMSGKIIIWSDPNCIAGTGFLNKIYGWKQIVCLEPDSLAVNRLISKNYLVRLEQDCNNHRQNWFDCFFSQSCCITLSKGSFASPGW